MTTSYDDDDSTIVNDKLSLFPLHSTPLVLNKLNQFVKSKCVKYICWPTNDFKRHKYLLYSYACVHCKTNNIKILPFTEPIEISLSKGRGLLVAGDNGVDQLTAYTGDTITMACRISVDTNTSPFVTWQKEKNIVSFNGALASGYDRLDPEEDPPGQTWKLTINEVNEVDNGLWICSETSNGLEASVNLGVIGEFLSLHVSVYKCYIICGIFMPTSVPLRYSVATLYPSRSIHWFKCKYFHNNMKFIYLWLNLKY